MLQSNWDWIYRNCTDFHRPVLVGGVVKSTFDAGGKILVADAVIVEVEVGVIVEVEVTVAVGVADRVGVIVSVIVGVRCRVGV